MTRLGSILIIILLFGFGAKAQRNIQDVLKEVLSNNLNLKSVDIEKQLRILEDKEALILEDPELLGAYLWGSPSFIGNRTNIEAAQKFKFPAYYSRQKKVNNISSSIYDAAQEAEFNSTLYEALDLLTDLAYLSKRKEAAVKRFENLESLSKLSADMFKLGEISRIESDKAELLANIYKQDLLMLESELSTVKRKLANLNGGMDIVIPQSMYSDLDKLFGKRIALEALVDNPLVNIADLNKQKAAAQLGVAKTSYLPDLQFGYMSEAINDEKLAGMQFGLTVPIWGKSNKMKRARLNKNLLDHHAEQTRLILKSDWDNNNDLAQKSFEVKSNLEKSLGSVKSKELLSESWKLGEISLLEYLLELPFYFDVEDKLLDAENQYYKALISQNRNHLKGLTGL